MVKYRVINVSAIEEGYPKEEYSSELFDTYGEALQFMLMTAEMLKYYDDKYEIEAVNL